MASNNHDLGKPRFSLSLRTGNQWLKQCSWCSCCTNQSEYTESPQPRPENTQRLNKPEFLGRVYLPPTMPGNTLLSRNLWRWMGGRTDLQLVWWQNSINTLPFSNLHGSNGPNKWIKSCILHQSFPSWRLKNSGFTHEHGENRIGIKRKKTSGRELGKYWKRIKDALVLRVKPKLCSLVDPSSFFPLPSNCSYRQGGYSSMSVIVLQGTEKHIAS